LKRLTSLVSVQALLEARLGAWVALALLLPLRLLPLLPLIFVF
jgi:hypothetical protein